MTLYHYTCDHGYAALGDAGNLVPAYDLAPDRLEQWWPARLVWLTDLAVPDRDALGLTRRIARCDRTAYRYRVTDEADVSPWIRVRRSFPAEELEWQAGVRPRHWYVSGVPVPVVLDLP